LSDAVETETFRSGDVIVQAGQVLDKVYVVQEGVAHAVDSSDSVVDSLKSGDTYGKFGLCNTNHQAGGMLMSTYFI
jgi:signal-transduction protein with cAMP-binding, CBS, and nucleotidyltransferase domain